MKAIAYLVIFILIACSDKDKLIQPKNTNPEIQSLTVFPELVKPTDSLIVICKAVDPDGDTLVYDWITTGVVKIKGARGDEHWLYNTYDNNRIFYAPDSSHVTAPLDTFWIQCFARDRRGESDNRMISFIVKTD